MFSGGGTGGHLYPALALADALAERVPGLVVRFVGAQRGLEAKVLPERGIETLLLDVEGLSRSAPVRNLGVLWRLQAAVRLTLRAYREWKPSLVVVTGGYAGAPAGLGAAALRIPLVLQEQNSWPGVTTRLLARWARQIHLAFPEAVEKLSRRARPLVRHSGNPIRGLPPLNRPDARRSLGLAADRSTLLVTGGSQGSAALNRLTLDAIASASSADLDVQVLWSTGPTHNDATRHALAQLGSPPWVTAVPYIDDMPRALRAADLALSRAGAMTTSEFLAAGLPAILIPLPTAAANHQRHNAEALAAAGVALHFDESAATGGVLWDVIEALLHDPPKLARMSEVARQRARPQAAKDIAEALAGLLPEAL